jgi:hypothetical protein
MLFINYKQMTVNLLDLHVENVIWGSGSYASDMIC